MNNRFTYRAVVVIVTVALGSWSLASTWTTCEICGDAKSIEDGQPSIREDPGRRNAHPTKILINLAEFLAGFR